MATMLETIMGTFQQQYADHFDQYHFGYLAGIYNSPKNANNLLTSVNQKEWLRGWEDGNEKWKEQQLTKLLTGDK